METKADYTCECVEREGRAGRLYVVTGHNGNRTICSYCDDCANLARIDWNGETAKIEEYRE